MSKNSLCGQRTLWMARLNADTFIHIRLNNTLITKNTAFKSVIELSVKRTTVVML